MTTFPAGPSLEYEPVGEQRTSIMAVLSLVFSLICFIPGLSVLGILLGVGALIAISGARGRLGGRGLAVTGLVIGVVVTAVWIGMAVGAGRVWGMFRTTAVGPVSQMFTDIEAGNYTAARAPLVPNAAAAITDADFARFRDSYQAQLGEFKGVPDGLIEFMQAYGTLGPVMNRVQGRNDAFPMPAQFEKGLALVVVYMDPQGGGNNKMPMGNIEIVPTAAGATPVRLYEAPSGSRVPQPGDAGSPTDPSQGEAPAGPPESEADPVGAPPAPGQG